MCTVEDEIGDEYNRLKVNSISIRPCNSILAGNKGNIKAADKPDFLKDLGSNRVCSKTTRVLQARPLLKSV